MCVLLNLYAVLKRQTQTLRHFFFFNGIFRSAQGRKITAKILLYPILSCPFPFRWRLHYVNEQDMKKMAFIVALLNYVVSVLTSLMLCY